MSKVLLADEVLINHIKNGGSERLKAIENIFNKSGLRDRVSNYVSYNGGGQEEGHDVFVEAILITERNIRKDKFKGDSTISTYTYGVAKKYWANKLRLKKQHTLSLEHAREAVSEYHNPELIFISDELKENLSKVINLLSEKCRNVIKLWSNGLKYSEIAKELNVQNTSQLRKMKYDCQQKLKDALSAKPELIPNYYNGKLGRK